MDNFNDLYKQWSTKAILDSDLIKELKGIEGVDAEISDRFYRALEFGTGGLRGVIGAGTNRMNVYTVGQATQGLADYLNSDFEEPSVAIAFDTRNKSELFARDAAGVLAANGIKVYIYDRPVPTPMLSYAVRALGCSSGIVITASHNPAKYNGYKCYDPNGYQMTDEAAAKTYGYITKTDVFDGVKRLTFDEGLVCDMIEYIEDWVFDGFYSEVLTRQINPGIAKSADLKVIYTPLNGTGNKPVRHILKKIGVPALEIVPTQEKPNGDFPTCPFPNPEIRQSFEEALKLTGDFKADMLLATDPDCDRVGIAVLSEGEYKLMTGNEVGAMLTEYVLSQLTERGELPENSVIIKSIVTTPLIDVIAGAYGAKCVSTLTGFKYIGEYVTELEAKNCVESFVLGMEESYGYLSGAHVRDKDAVVSSMLICEMAAYYKSKGICLYDFMNSIYEKYGFYINTLDNFTFEGAEGMRKMSDIMNTLRVTPPEFVNGEKVIKITDFLSGESLDVASGEKTSTGLPSSNVLEFRLSEGDCLVVRPSGTEPKLKAYVTSNAPSKTLSLSKSKSISEDVKRILGV